MEKRRQKCKQTNKKHVNMAEALQLVICPGGKMRKREYDYKLSDHRLWLSIGDIPKMGLKNEELLYSKGKIF